MIAFSFIRRIITIERGIFLDPTDGFWEQLRKDGRFRFRSFVRKRFANLFAGNPPVFPLMYSRRGLRRLFMRIKKH